MFHRGRADRFYCPEVVRKLQVTCWRVSDSSGVRVRQLGGSGEGTQVVEVGSAMSEGTGGARVGPE